MTKEELQSIMNATFGRLSMFCRDLELDESLIAKYRPNQIIMERGFTDLSSKVGGMGTNCRYLVASSSGRDLSMFSQQPELGHIVIQSSAFYKVLHIHKENGKTQILLLHIPKEGVPIFSKSKINLEDQIIEKGIEVFNRTLHAKPVAALQSKDWLERTSFPLGMTQEGVLFLDTPRNDESLPQI
jgi:hypothetical protein